MPEIATFPGTAVWVRVARAAVPILVGASPRLEDIALVVSEFATNAILHSRSGDAGEFQLGIDRKPGWARVELMDEGPTGEPPPRMLLPPVGGLDDSELADHGRGLLLVAAAADRWGHDSQPDAGTWWAEFAWDEDEGGTDG